MSQIKEGEIVIDPMCGCSTLPEIAMKSCQKEAFYICCDINPIAIRKSSENLENLSDVYYFDII